MAACFSPRLKDAIFFVCAFAEVISRIANGSYFRKAGASASQYAMIILRHRLLIISPAYSASSLDGDDIGISFISSYQRHYISRGHEVMPRIPLTTARSPRCSQRAEPWRFRRHLMIFFLGLTDAAEAEHA